MEIDPQLVKQLREKTNAGMMDCKRALAESGADLEKAEALLRTRGIASAGKKASRATKEGIVASYIHLQGKVGVLVEVNCETDFVAKNEGFREFVKDITLHIAAAHPLYVRREEVPQKLVDSERAIYEAQVKGKPENVVARKCAMITGARITIAWQQAAVDGAGDPARAHAQRARSRRFDKLS